MLELEDPLRDAPGGGDHDDDHDPRLELEHLDVPHRRRLERRRRDEREQVSRVGERLRRASQRLLQLVPHRGQVERERRRPSLDHPDELLRVEAIAALGGDAPCGRVGMHQEPDRLELGELAPNGRRRQVETHAPSRGMRVHEQADRLELGELVADGRGRDVEPRALHERLEPTGTPVATYSSTTRRRISRFRWLSSISLPIVRPASAARARRSASTASRAMPQPGVTRAARP